ncbi:MAG: hypothetical protein QOG53_3555 [Frankiales bacterium]|nr:hypothetical protein [Frankiales bacterium]
MLRLLLAVIAFAGACLLLLYVAGELGALGVVLGALVEAAAIAAIWKASAQV